MTTNDIAILLTLVPLAGTNAVNEVSGCYIGDLLSNVMVRAKKGDAWITVIGNVNTIAVAKHTGVSCVILCENTKLDDDAMNRAEEYGIPVYSSRETAYSLAIKLYKILQPYV